MENALVKSSKEKEITEEIGTGLEDALKDVKKIDKLRQRLDALGLYGKRIALLEGTLKTVKFPQYFSSLFYDQYWFLTVLHHVFS